MINLVIWLPAVGGLAACIAPRKAVGWISFIFGLAALGIAIAMTVGYQSGDGLQYLVDDNWLPDLGVSYKVGIDGISVFLVLMAALVWPAATAWSAIKTPERPATWYLLLALGQSGAIGAFCAQDLLLFVLFFDLMLIPFFFLFGSWGKDPAEGITASAATIKMMIYTLFGSLLMLVAAIATAFVASGGDAPLTFSIAAIQAHGVPESSQVWLFCFFAIAFLVKMPIFPAHGWVRDAYRAAPLPALALFTAVLSKVGAYGFIKIGVPLFPHAAALLQQAILILALCSIIYGSVMAFSQNNARLVAAFSSIAQMGFILLGIFSLRTDGLDGAVLQMVNHGLVVVPMMLIIAFLADRVGSDDLSKMGGLAFRAPFLAAIFLVVTMAVLALPGSANFVGEFYILRGAFEADIAVAVIATLGVAMAGFYALRLYQRSMHNREAEAGASVEISVGRGAILSALVAVIVALALYPQLILDRIDGSADAQIAAAARDAGQTPVDETASRSVP